MKKPCLISSGFVLNFLLALALSAQSDTSSPPTATVDWNSASDLEVLLQAVEMTPTIPATAAPREATFWSAQHAPGTRSQWPPLPTNARQNSLWNLGDDVFLLSDLKVDYSVPPSSMRTAGGMMMAADDSGPGGITNIGTPLFGLTLPDYGTNLYIAQPNVASNYFSGIVSNTAADVQYEIQSVTDLTQTNWNSEGFIYGSELTNWTPLSVTQNGRANLFLKIRSWADSTGTGIPDWWWLQYFGQTTNVDAYGDPAGDGWNNLQKFQNGMNPTQFDTPPLPSGFSAMLAANQTNILLSWNLSPGPVQNYTLGEYVYSSASGNWTYQQVTQLNASATSFADVGAFNPNNSDNYNNYFDVQADYTGGSSPQATSGINFNSSPPPATTTNDNIYLTAYLIRNGTGRWQVMFSGLPTNGAQTIQLTWTDGSGTTPQNILVGNATNGIYQIPDTDAVNFMSDSLSAQLFGPEGEPGQVAQAGVLSPDAPYFVDGRRHMKQNLNFLLEAASVSQPFGSNMMDGYIRGEYGYPDYNAPAFNQTATNFEEFSFLHHALDYNQFPIATLDNLWPFTANYDLANDLVDITRTNLSPFGSTNFNFVPNFATNVPAPPMLNPEPKWILQPGFLNYADYPQYNTSGNWGVTLQDTQTVAQLQSGLKNLYGLPYQTGCVVDWQPYPTFDLAYQFFNAGSSVTVPSGYTIGVGNSEDGYASQCPAPSLLSVNYYFAPLINPSMDAMNLPPVGQQPFPLPIDDAFNVTNQTPPVIVGTVGQPMILGAWAKYSISNSSPTKYAYLGQYFATNAFLLDASGNVTTNSAGVLSPYGEFFPLQSGMAELVTMPDIDTGMQGTNVVKIISLNVDANHDGTMDLSYSGPDQTSPSRPLRFWIDDSSDSGDYGGTGVPGQGPQGNGVLPINVQWVIHGRRDLVNCFPVYLNIGSLFQSNALSAGISATDTNWQFVLSQADGALRFAYTGLTPTNYMNFLQDTNESGNLAYTPGNSTYATLTTITPNGVAVSNSFLNGIATANGGIILVEAWTNTTQPLVLSIYHGTNQIAQTSLYLSINGVESMFRYKNLLTGAATNQLGLPADRLTDASVPNEPDTIDKNVVFVHGYNVNPQQARGWFADIYKRLYWSGSHAKFYGVNWYGNDSQGDYVAGVTANYQTNVVHAFQTAPLLANFIATLTNGPTVVLAHSLGNMVVLSALSDYGAPMSQYFMLDAAVPMEAIDGSTPITNDMVFSTTSYSWLAYSNTLWAGEWFTLWPTNDARSTLTWSNRLSNFGSASVYNFYSSGEDVLRTYSDTPPGSLFTLFGAQLVQYIEGQSGTYVWAWQEKDKGRMSGNSILSSDHGGWGFNFYYSNYSINQANALPPSQLQTNAFFDVSVDVALFTTSSSGSSYALANRNRILSDAIPALTLPIGANPVSRLQPPNNPTQNNFDMQANQNGWPVGRAINPSEANKWHHSDIRVIAYTFTYEVFNEIVNDGNLK